MRICLLLLFIILNSFISTSKHKIRQSDDKYITILNTRYSALGDTGMIFGEEFGSFYSAPTSMQNENINFLFSLYIPLIEDSSCQFCSYFRTSFGHLSMGINTLLFSYSTVPLVYSFDFYNLSLGFGITYNNNDNGILSVKKDRYFSGNISAMYKSFIGNFALSLNDYLIKIVKKSDNFPNKNSFLNLRIGYGKEFNINYIFDKVQFALEVKNLFINKSEKEYNLLSNIHIGLEFSKDIDVHNIALRAGIKNLLPTFGISLGLLKSLRVEYTLTNIQSRDNNSRKLEILFSVNSILSNASLKNLNNYKRYIQRERFKKL